MDNMSSPQQGYICIRTILMGGGGIATNLCSPVSNVDNYSATYKLYITHSEKFSIEFVASHNVNSLSLLNGHSSSHTLPQVIHSDLKHLCEYL